MYLIFFNFFFTDTYTSFLSTNYSKIEKIIKMKYHTKLHEKEIKKEIHFYKFKYLHSHVVLIYFRYFQFFNPFHPIVTIMSLPWQSFPY